MTREEAIENLKILKEDYWDDDGYGHETKQYDDTMLALDMAIKALEQDTVLDKIRVEIEQEIEQVKIARKVFHYEKIDAVKAEECSGSITAYHNVIAFIDQVMKQGRK